MTGIPQARLELIRQLLGGCDLSEPEDARYAYSIQKVIIDFEESMVEAGVDDYSFWAWVRDDTREFYAQVMAYLEEVKCADCGLPVLDDASDSRHDDCWPGVM